MPPKSASPHEYGDDSSTSSSSSSEDEGSGGYVCSHSEESEEITSDTSTEAPRRSLAKRNYAGRKGGRKQAGTARKKKAPAKGKLAMSNPRPKNARRRIPSSSPESMTSETEGQSASTSPALTVHLRPGSPRSARHSSPLSPVPAPRSSPESSGSALLAHSVLHEPQVFFRQSWSDTSVHLNAERPDHPAAGIVSRARHVIPLELLLSPSSRVSSPGEEDRSTATTNAIHLYSDDKYAEMEGAAAINWKVVKVRFPWLEPHPHTGSMLIEAGRTIFEPSNLIFLVNPRSNVLPARWQYFIHACGADILPIEGESPADRYVLAFCDRSVWTMAWSAWMSAVQMFHPDPTPVNLALSRVLDWCLEIRSAKKWRSVMQFMFHMQAKLLTEDGEVIGRRWCPDDWYTSAIYAEHLGTAADRGHAPVSVSAHGRGYRSDMATSAGEVGEQEPCRAWNMLKNGCSKEAHGSNNVALHVCLVCRGEHRLVENQVCWKTAVDRRIVTR